MNKTVIPSKPFPFLYLVFINVAVMPQPFEWMNIKKSINLAQQQVCGPRSQVVARFDSKDDVFAYRRLLHNHLELAFVLALQKNQSFTSTSTGCQKTMSSISDLANLTHWSVGEPHVASTVFSAESFIFDGCNQMCLSYQLISRNNFSIADVPCSTSYTVVCRNMSRE